MIDFASFFAAAHARDGRPGPMPYPWQADLAHRLATAAPPKAIVAPTGGGKTATIDALIWALAFQADRSPVLRTVGVRTVWAIDRRILVDEVHAHARDLAERLAQATSTGDEGDPLHSVAQALLTLTGDGSPPLVATRWRGGLAIGSPALHPFQPEIITSTVAQVGSRLLFRGYGVGRRSLAVQAALTAVDTTVCLDEAHLAEPFRQTVEAIVQTRRAEPVALPPLHAITLTATPAAAVAPADVVAITDADRPLLGPRLTGEKRARLVEPASVKPADRRDALLDAVEAHLEAGSRSVACVVNSVRTAVDVYRALARRRPEVQRMILVGPQRPADRAGLLERHRGELFERVSRPSPLVVVATQTFEVGLDADVEALVTESASVSALVQRLGRLNRAGVRQGAATIVRNTEPGLYEREEPAAWAWLTQLVGDDGTIDVSVQALGAAPGRPEPARGVLAPSLSAAVLDRLVQTEPRPAPMDDPDIDVFLRGADAQPSADVMVVWRADLRSDDRSSEGRAYREALLRLAPPRPEELVTISIARAHALLAALRAEPEDRRRLGARTLDGPDVEGGDEPLLSSGPGTGADAFAPVLLRGDEHLEADPGGWVPPRPGDVIVLPTEVGGYLDGVLDHASRAVVPDVGPDVIAAGSSGAGGRPGEPPPFWRLTDAVLGTTPALFASCGRIARAAAKAADAQDRAVADAHAAQVASLIAEAVGVPLAELGLGVGATLAVRRVTPRVDLFAGDADDLDGADDAALGFGLDDDDDDGDGADADSDLGSTFADESTPGPAFVLTVGRSADPGASPVFGTSPPTLHAHAVAVAARVRAYAERAALPRRFVDTLVLAAMGHDHGKADPRTQAFFRGGSAGLGDEVIAKSVFGTEDRRADRVARRASGLPHDFRHEVESVVVMQDALASGGIEGGVPPDLDAELVMHVVGTHHGLGLPVPRLPHGGALPRAYVARGAGITGVGYGDGSAAWGAGEWLERFLTLNDRFGPWGLAYLRTLLVLADRTVSREHGRADAPLDPALAGDAR